MLQHLLQHENNVEAIKQAINRKNNPIKPNKIKTIELNDNFLYFDRKIIVNLNLKIAVPGEDLCLPLKKF